MCNFVRYMVVLPCWALLRRVQTAIRSRPDHGQASPTMDKDKDTGKRQQQHDNYDEDDKNERRDRSFQPRDENREKQRRQRYG